MGNPGRKLGEGSSAMPGVANNPTNATGSISPAIILKSAPPILLLDGTLVRYFPHILLIHTSVLFLFIFRANPNKKKGSQ